MGLLEIKQKQRKKKQNKKEKKTAQEKNIGLRGNLKRKRILKTNIHQTLSKTQTKIKNGGGIRHLREKKYPQSGYFVDIAKINGDNL